MIKILSLFLFVFLFTSCSFNKSSKFWTSETLEKLEEKKFEKIFDNQKALDKEFNTNINLNLRLNIRKLLYPQEINILQKI